ncbi:TetR/AcrR family transcriptional regulator [Lentzea sp. CC55]|uniref:TetR/AcrR family transcriptional regulator n=1 Tax=Lentzea sp. CC55 TaxID=2884909 RepID=UPI0027E16C50|nr:TetR/AcrR family transcriptional regulator [Lentzea sp. CC55]MCG8925932.1 TetR/AcrR family transcriptional regulator [Lentzea sp. CC55]
MKRLSKQERRDQLLATARRMVREEGADRLTLARLSDQAGVSKPVVYDHFPSRSVLLIELYRTVDAEQVQALRTELARGRDLRETADVLAVAYIRCFLDTGGEWHAIGAALEGSAEKVAVHHELLDGYVRLFASVLKPHSSLSPAELKRRCIGLVGAGEALGAAMLRGISGEQRAARSLAALIEAACR